MKQAIVIPARLESTRLPRKLLLKETGKFLIEHTYRAAEQSRLADQVFVATDSREIAQAVESFGGVAVMTSTSHVSGCDRIAEAALKIEAEIVVNLQGDEPEISPDSIDFLIRMLLTNPQASVATLCCPIQDEAELNDPSCVKVVFDGNRRALYFSRSPIPCPRDPKFQTVYFQSRQFASAACFFRHIGVYAFRRDSLLQLPRLAKCQIEQVEKLEQLRFLHAGWEILVGIVEHAPAGIDTPGDYALFVNRWKNR